MGVSFASYEIARSGLFVNERGLTVTGHNISNVNTAGFVRQQAMITTGPYQSETSRYGLQQFGLGADIQQVRQIRHTFLDNIYRQESTTFGYWEARNKTYQDVQAVLGEPMGTGLQSVMNQFWDSWQELSKAPDSLTVRALVRQRGEAFVHQVNHMGQQLDKLQEDLNSEIRVRIDEINNITQSIAGLNLQILQTEISGDAANDFRDQRNTLVDRLSKLANVEVTEMQDGQLDITLGGYFLVTKGIYNRLSAEETKAGGRFLAPKLAGTNIEVPIKSGTLKGLMEARGEVFAAEGSLENGTPNTKADVVFAIDTTMSNAMLTQIRDNITSYVNQLQKSGVDYNLRLITFGDSASSCNSYSNLAALIGAIPTTSSGEANNVFAGAGGVVDSLEAVTDFRDNATRHLIMFTNESVEGDTTAPGATPAAIADRLNGLNVKTSVVTDTSYYSTGDGTAGDFGWGSITDLTGGELYNINTAAADYADMMASIGSDTNELVNQEISIVEESTNIISDLKIRLNAMISLMVREVNRIHSSGKTLTGLNGGNFFAAIDSNYPMEMGNIKLDDSLASSSGLNNIVASASGGTGDNTIALEIANTRHTPLLGKIGETLSIDDFYRSIILLVGNNGNDALRISENQQKLVQSADSHRQSITGVSMDEEMSNMMKYKFAYSAASRHLNVIDEMMETIITRMGLAGR